jgi:trimeric autotransporter adhesin
MDGRTFGFGITVAITGTMTLIKTITALTTKKPLLENKDEEIVKKEESRQDQIESDSEKTLVLRTNLTQNVIEDQTIEQSRLLDIETESMAVRSSVLASIEEQYSLTIESTASERDQTNQKIFSSEKTTENEINTQVNISINEETEILTIERIETKANEHEKKLQVEEKNKNVLIQSSNELIQQYDNHDHHIEELITTTEEEIILHKEINEQYQNDKQVEQEEEMNSSSFHSNFSREISGDTSLFLALQTQHVVLQQKLEEITESQKRQIALLPTIPTPLSSSSAALHMTATTTADLLEEITRLKMDLTQTQQTANSAIDQSLTLQQQVKEDQEQLNSLYNIIFNINLPISSSLVTQTNTTNSTSLPTDTSPQREDMLEKEHRGIDKKLPSTSSAASSPPPSSSPLSSPSSSSTTFTKAIQRLQLIQQTMLQQQDEIKQQKISFKHTEQQSHYYANTILELKEHLQQLQFTKIQEITSLRQQLVSQEERYKYREEQLLHRIEDLEKLVTTSHQISLGTTTSFTSSSRLSSSSKQQQNLSTSSSVMNNSITPTQKTQTSSNNNNHRPTTPNKLTNNRSYSHIQSQNRSNTPNYHHSLSKSLFSDEEVSSPEQLHNTSHNEYSRHQSFNNNPYTSSSNMTNPPKSRTPSSHQSHSKTNQHFSSNYPNSQLLTPSLSSHLHHHHQQENHNDHDNDNDDHDFTSYFETINHLSPIMPEDSTSPILSSSIRSKSKVATIVASSSSSTNSSLSSASNQILSLKAQQQQQQTLFSPSHRTTQPMKLIQPQSTNLRTTSRGSVNSNNHNSSNINGNSSSTKASLKSEYISSPATTMKRVSSFSSLTSSSINSNTNNLQHTAVTAVGPSPRSSSQNRSIVNKRSTAVEDTMTSRNSHHDHDHHPSSHLHDRDMTMKMQFRDLYRQHSNDLHKLIETMEQYSQSSNFSDNK